MLAGRRIVLGVTGGIAAYKAIEVCRRLVDAGAHVVPVLTEGAQRFVGATTFSALASEPVQTSLFDERRPDPAHPARPGGRPRRRVPGHGPAARLATPPASPTTCSPPPCSPPGRRSSSARRCTPRCGSTRRCRTTWRLLAAAGRARRRRPRRAASPAATSAPGRLADPADIVAAVERGRSAPPDLAGLPRARHRRRHPRADRPGARSSATARRASRATPSPRRPRPRGAKVTLVTTVDRPVPAGRRRRPGRHRGRDGGGGAGPGRRPPTSSSWPPRWPTSGPVGAADRRSRRPTACPRSSSSRPDFLAELGAAKPPGPDARRLRRRDRRPAATTPRTSWPQGRSTSSSPTTSARPASVRARHQRRS